MKFLTKLAIFLELKNDSYSKSVDDLINLIIKKGEFVGLDYFRVHVRLYDEDYFLWGSNKWYGDLADCYKKDGVSYLYCNKRPSRFTQIRFWEWVEKHKPDLFSKKEPAYKREIKEILQRGEK